MHILVKLPETIQEPRADLKDHAPRIETLTIPKRIYWCNHWPGGKIIQGMQEETGATPLMKKLMAWAELKLPEPTRQSIDSAMRIIKGIVAVPEVGEVYKGKVRSIMPYGAFIEFLPERRFVAHL